MEEKEANSTITTEINRSLTDAATLKQQRGLWL